MMPIFQQHIPLASKTTLGIGGEALYYAEARTKEDVEEAAAFAQEKNLPLLPLGAGSNTIFADGTIHAVILKVIADAIKKNGSSVTVQTGTYLASLISECAKMGLDLSPLTGIPGTVGGAIFGNAGQGYGGVWFDTFIESVEVFLEGSWKNMKKEECAFGYRTSIFKTKNSEFTAQSALKTTRGSSQLLWSTTLSLPKRPSEEITAEINRLLKRRIETQPHRKTAGSCFLSKGKETPAWKLIDAQGLRGYRIGDMQISEKHANFLLNTDQATYADAKQLVQHIQKAVPEELSVEMRFVEEDGSLAF